MNLLKGLALLLLLLFFAGVAFLVAVPAILTRQRWRFLNDVFLKPFGVCARTIIGVEIEYLQLERAHAARPMVLIGNHQSALDLAIIGSMCPDGSVIVGKKEIAWIPLFGWYFRAAGNLMIDRSKGASAQQALKATAKRVQNELLNVAIFPEGTRNRDPSTGFLTFKKGGFHLAKELKAPILPVVCSSLKGKALWESLELGGGKVVISLLEPVSVQDWKEGEFGQRIESLRQQMLQEYERINLLAGSGKVR